MGYLLDKMLYTYVIFENKIVVIEVTEANLTQIFF